MADYDPGDRAFGAGDGAGGPDGGGAPQGAIDPALWRSKWPMNDLGNAQRFAELAAGRLLFCGELGRSGEWLWFDDQRWSRAEGGARAQAVALAVHEALLDESRALRLAAASRDMAAIHTVYGAKFDAAMAEERAGHLFVWAMKAGNTDRTNGMMKQAAALTDDAGRFVMRARLEDFDTDPLAYNCANGVVYFRQVPADLGGEYYAEFVAGHRPGDMMMQMAGVTYDPAAECPHWTARLVQLHDDPVAREMLQRLYGSTLTGLTSDQAFYVFQGKGGDGKSMTNDIIAGLHGDYFRASGPQTFLNGKQKNGSDHQSDIVRLRGDVRLVVTDEPPKGSTWNGERIKQVTGSKIVARGVNALEEITYSPRWKLIVECNPLPRAPSDDRGFRRRFKLLPWVKSYGVTAGLIDEAADVVKGRLNAELSGILNWMIDGAVKWLCTRELPEPALAALAASNYWSTGSALVEWLDANCDLSDPDAVTGATELYNDFKRYCIDVRGDKDEAVMHQTSFGRAMNERHHYKLPKDAAGRINRQGIRLKAGASGSAASAADAGDWRAFSTDAGAWDRGDDDD